MRVDVNEITAADPLIGKDARQRIETTHKANFRWVDAQMNVQKWLFIFSWETTLVSILMIPNLPQAYCDDAEGSELRNHRILRVVDVTARRMPRLK